MTSPICPCGSLLPYADCCGIYHDGTAKPATAEALMRSRYSAFVQQRAEYLVNTLHPDKRRPEEHQALLQSFQDTRWEGLVIVNKERGQASDTDGVVEFVASYRSSRGPGRLHERSRFVKAADQWLYVDGDMMQPPTPGRNEPCWCGSGKKFKKCHG